MKKIVFVAFMLLCSVSVSFGEKSSMLEICDCYDKCNHHYSKMGYNDPAGCMNKECSADKLDSEMITRTTITCMTQQTLESTKQGEEK